MFPPQSTLAAVSISIANDFIAETNENFFIMLQTVEDGAANINVASAEVTLLDDDGVYVNMSYWNVTISFLFLKLQLSPYH